jgi:Cdc6-like AAA superfamily ATPase
LEAIANLQTGGEVPARSKEIQRTYEQVADSHAASPLSTLKSIQDHLSDLHMLGFLRRHEQNKGLSGGQYYEYELDLDPTIVLETRTEIATHTE